MLYWERFSGWKNNFTKCFSHHQIYTANTMNGWKHQHLQSVIRNLVILGLKYIFFKTEDAFCFVRSETSRRLMRSALIFAAQTIKIHDWLLTVSLSSAHNFYLRRHMTLRWVCTFSLKACGVFRISVGGKEWARMEDKVI